ncbi:MAG: dihydrolipoyl dehydrogenase [Caldiserica bacterium]|nr:dihydrolipoyl dehydrogenase [Caldisericota bacterium]
MKKKVVILGGGPAGYSAAIRCAQLGAEVAVVEKENLGGVCLNHGCIPTKTLVKTAELAKEVKNAPAFGVEVDFKGIDWGKVFQRKNEVVKKLTGGIGFLFRHYGIEWIREEGKLTREGITVGGKLIPADNIILATGSSAVLLPGIAGKRILTHREALMIEKLPERVLIIGGGVNGCEFAHIFSSAGVEVTLVEMLDRLLPGEDGEISRGVEKALRKQGVKIYTSCKASEIEESESAASCRIGEEKWEGDYLILCLGRKRNTDGFSEAGIEVSKEGVQVNEYLETSLPGVYAAGDILPTPQLAHVAYREGKTAAENVMGERVEINYGAIPRVIFTSPEAASVGMSEEELKNRGIPYSVERFPFTASGKALSEGDTEGWAKILVHEETEEILALHIFSHNAGELLGEGILAINLEATPEDIASSIHPHPTRSESIQEVAELFLGQPLHFLK